MAKGYAILITQHSARSRGGGFRQFEEKARPCSLRSFFGIALEPHYRPWAFGLWHWASALSTPTLSGWQGGIMPNRIIKESICVSEKIAALSDFEFRLWVGLITAVDDAGRGDARAAIIKGRVFPLRERITIKDIDAALLRLAAKGCVSLYEVEGKPYFWFPTWGKHQRIRDCKPKYPSPEEQNGSPALEDAPSPPPAAACGDPPPESQSKSQSQSKGEEGLWEEIRRLYHQICVSYPPCSILSAARKQAIQGRLEAGYGLEDFRRLFEQAEASSFLKGQNERNWRANFDWLLREGNMVKTLEGRYGDGPRGGAAKRLDDLDDLF